MEEFLNNIPDILNVFVEKQVDGTLTGIIPSMMALFQEFPLNLFLGLTVVSFGVGAFRGLFRSSGGD